MILASMFDLLSYFHFLLAIQEIIVLCPDESYRNHQNNLLREYDRHAAAVKFPIDSAYLQLPVTETDSAAEKESVQLSERLAEKRC